ncbi:hypothetical protein [Xanthomarina sp. F2636L]|uniref:hypothetical protein n=1 Tax=Xanthomarina sp. F2636L TaxID=2996018 RepID=UPI00225DE771|nr:hypothetical protein [Xanthomarina sp. F2636L]MCX7549602.1 hypothetical protein [Xanthomarina sp. F2636L]
MQSDRQLIKATNQWFVMFLIMAGMASLFYWHPSIEVKNIGEIQFSQTLSNFNSNIQEHYKNLRNNTYYDFGFIIIYSLLFYTTYRVFQSSTRTRVSKLWIILCLAPGVFDIIENILLLNLLTHSESTWMFNAFWFVVRAKWTLVIPFVLINLTILVYYLIRGVNSVVD